MSTNLKDRLEKIELLLTKISEESERGRPIIVEGKKDLEALQELGANGPILTLKTAGKSFLQATEEIEALGAGEVILLLDFDRRGRDGTKLLQESLERGKIKVNVKFWGELHSLAGREVSCIESLPAYIATIQQKAGQKIP